MSRTFQIITTMNSQFCAEHIPHDHKADLKNDQLEREREKEDLDSTAYLFSVF